MHRLALELLLFSLSVVLVITLSPFNFAELDYLFWQSSLDKFSQAFNAYPSTSIEEIIANILLFLPLGFSIAVLLSKPLKLRAVYVLLISTVLCLLFSILVEFLQLFLPSRTTSAVDIFTNAIGGGLGSFLSVWVQQPNPDGSKSILHKLAKRFSYKVLLLALALYLLVAFPVTLILQRSTLLSSWDLSYPLILGNEITGDRPWEGSITSLTLADRAIEPKTVKGVLEDRSVWESISSSVVADFSFQEGNERTIQQPEQQMILHWYSSLLKKQIPTKDGVLLDRNHWLTTGDAATMLNRRIRSTSQFTLDLSFAPAVVPQYGPARIVSLSGGIYARNFTIAQEANQLVIRLRTRLTGNNGTKPEIVIPGFFSGTSPHRIIVTYDNKALNIYTDSFKDHLSFDMNPGMLIARTLLLRFGDWMADPRVVNTGIYKFLYFSVLFVPLGAFLAFCSFLFKRNQGLYYFVLVGVALISPLLVLDVDASVDHTIMLDDQFTCTSLVLWTGILVRTWLLRRYDIFQAWSQAN